MSDLNDAKVLLKKFFGYDNFRTGQEEIISHILNHEDCLGIMPTGAGKSICYQIPAMLMDGTCIVVSPLISLMKDQVDGLNQLGIPATFINSTLTPHQYEQTIENAASGIYKIIYVAPERLDSDTFFQLLKHLHISMFAVDEAHCVSRWGHDFRPSYTQIANVILNLEPRPIVTAFTATATELVKDDIVSLLHLESPFCLTTGFDRKNLNFSVKSVENRKKFVYEYVQSHLDDSGIVYCLTRKSVDDLYENLLRLGVKASKYHAGMTDKQRTDNQNDFVYDRTSVMVATNAFGMGIDKSNIRYVIHFNMPRDIESYYQEAGRAGRDGDSSDCILLFNRSDIVTNKFLIEQGSPDVNHSNEYQKLNDMVDYCNTDKCLRKYILEYFGESPDFDECHNCSNCASDVEVTDITIDSKKILSCIKRMHERFGSGLVTDVLKGSHSAKVVSMGFDKLSTHGIMSEYSKATIKDLISFLVTEGYIKNVGDKYPVLVLTPSANDILFGDKSVFIKRKIEKLETRVSSSAGSRSGSSGSVSGSSASNRPLDESLFNILRDLRREVAYKSNVPPFLVFADVSLKQMASDYPISVNSFLNINGVGRYKMERYGYIFLDAIREYVKENNIDVYWDDENAVPSDEVDGGSIGSVSSGGSGNTSVSGNSSASGSAGVVGNSENSSSSYGRDRTANKKRKYPVLEKESTRQISYNLYMQGKSVEEIANIRQLTKQTIQGHLLDCYKEGMEIDLEKEIHTQYKDVIFDAIRKFGTEKLKPLKEAVPEEVSYLDIRYYVLEFEKE